eukprot:CAMPEP_0182588916 /NCGR_PEP_ID=MMETSP1324-20130603/68328_1 /TAXON_ID=236786 /ORGANISM="Florenciella sp., Strain RCC1587" /LENGTH=147 /DNA_ID=CAMNT_0024806027 /DNA_START=3 /DNA_END=446 /DNA_ORIENTATION=+
MKLMVPEHTPLPFGLAHGDDSDTRGSLPPGEGGLGQASRSLKGRLSGQLKHNPADVASPARDPLSQLGTTLRDVRVERERVVKLGHDSYADKLLAKAGLGGGLLGGWEGAGEKAKENDPHRFGAENEPVAQVVHRVLLGHRVRQQIT